MIILAKFQQRPVCGSHHFKENQRKCMLRCNLQHMENLNSVHGKFPLQRCPNSGLVYMWYVVCAPGTQNRNVYIKAYSLCEQIGNPFMQGWYCLLINADGKRKEHAKT